ncbi:SPFH domain-containing protein [Mycoplasmopsis alligatoris]|uniref:SPFH/Band 7/PHB domain protein n=1 Tax=Mycoplasmopsis alligatoris A21JP2 TaxID=747682 RepID=D4XWP8_9BACT|nr:SPFH domain-containing protein [Mycoplasmopsis alligatoris]EFF41318.1 SPFH/Band 7/PHB domain protein [Mycoplasmopsis alligatoris A21JP2]
MWGYIIGGTVGGLVLITIIIILAFSIRIVPPTNFYIVERLGSYKKTWQNGIHVKLPFVDKISNVNNYMEKVLDFEPQEVITRDNVSIKVDTIIFFQITDAKKFTYGAEQPIFALEKLASTTLRNLLGELELDETLTSRETVNAKLTIALDDASDSWGIKVHRVELKNITPPAAVQIAMEKQMQAEREKRAAILEAEGQREAAIKVSEGLKASSILEAEGKKESVILAAEAHKRSIDLLNETIITNQVLTYKAIEGLEKLANGNATKIIIPPNLQDIAGIMGTASELFKADPVKKSSTKKTE